MALVLNVAAKEGMWIPMLISSMESDMQTRGMKLSAEDIYNINQSSLKDAIVHFGGGCTGEVISNQGLILTNHHCGYGQIQSHSSVENDYLTDGFWAKTMKDELRNPGLFVTFIVKIEDVTDQVLGGLDTLSNPAMRAQVMAKRKKELVQKATKDSHYEGFVREFYYGNQYFMFITETFNDVRLVGAPPSSIGKFGFDTDNWVWPRHTGDFSMFRIYADKDNKPAEYSEDNVPYQPKHHLPVSLKGYEPNDFTMVYGFPGRTYEYVTSYHMNYVVNKSNPARIKMRDTSLEIIGKAMQKDKKTNIQYAAKQSRISNAWKKWIGQSKGLKELNAVDKKRAQEELFQSRIAENAEWNAKYGNLLNQFETLYADHEKYAFARDLLIEIYYYGPEIIRYAGSFEKLLAEELTEEETETIIAGLKSKTAGFYKNYNAEVDQQLMQAMMPMYLSYLDAELRPSSAYDRFQDAQKHTEYIYKKTIFSSQEKVNDFLDSFKKSSVKKLMKDPALQLSKQILDTYSEKVRDQYSLVDSQINALMSVYMEGLMTVLDDQKNYYPDANSTLRVSYGKVAGYQPKDGVSYAHYTTIDGIIEKMDTTSKEFDVPEKLVELYHQQDFGRYADENNNLRVCFIASNHTSGGNSGSPAINANGELIGLNFDRTWESTMSDFLFDPERCRNIMVDIRYVLFIVDKFAGMNRLIEEMTLVENTQEVETTIIHEEVE